MTSHGQRSRSSTPAFGKRKPPTTNLCTRVLARNKAHLLCCVCVGVCLQVLEGWLQWASMGILQHSQVMHAVSVLIKNLSTKLRSAGKVSQRRWYVAVSGWGDHGQSSVDLTSALMMRVR